MRNVCCAVGAVSPELSVVEAAELLRTTEATHLSVAVDGVLVGIVTEQDLEGISEDDARSLTVGSLTTAPQLVWL
ncbi:MAG: hypothetical protein CMJ83_07580 [Planctomycetes bacterium]|nr:hypothetical protein [Planctomycetota bacterium]